MFRELKLRSNQIQCVGAKKKLQEFKYLLKWPSDGCECVLDVGCGTVEMTMDILLPNLPANFIRLSPKKY